MRWRRAAVRSPSPGTRRGGLSVEEVAEDLEHHSGLVGLAPASAGDLRLVVEAADRGEAQAELAHGVYLHRLKASIAAMVAAMGGFEGLVFTGGVGEGSARVRRDTCDALAFLGLGSPEEGPATGDRLLTVPGRFPAVVVVEAREDLEITRHVRTLLS